MCSGAGGAHAATIILLTPKASDIDAATRFVEHVKEDFPNMVPALVMHTVVAAGRRDEAGGQRNRSHAFSSLQLHNVIAAPMQQAEEQAGGGHGGDRRRAGEQEESSVWMMCLASHNRNIVPRQQEEISG